MAGYFEGYGVEEAKRNNVVKAIVFTFVGLCVAGVLSYFFLHDYSEKQVVNKFLAQLNSHDYQGAYRAWCPEPCRDYDFGRFSADWGPQKKTNSPWRVDSTDSCKYFLTINVTADGGELQSLSVQRDSKMLSFAPSPECQEPKWRWKQFFKRFFGESEPPVAPPSR